MSEENPFAAPESSLKDVDQHAPADELEPFKILAEQTPESTKKMRNQRLGAIAGTFSFFAVMYLMSAHDSRSDEQLYSLIAVLIFASPFIGIFIYFLIKYADPEKVLHKKRRVLELTHEEFNVLILKDGQEESIVRVMVPEIKKVKLKYPYLDIKIGFSGNPHIDITPYDNDQVKEMVERMKDLAKFNKAK